MTERTFTPDEQQTIDHLQALRAAREMRNATLSLATAESPFPIDLSAVAGNPHNAANGERI